VINDREREHEKLRVLAKIIECKRELLYREARRDFFVFQRAVMRTETNAPWVPAQVHREWDAFFEAHDRAIFWAPIEHGKTEQRSIAKTLWLLGGNPNLRQAIISETSTQADKICSAIKGYIETSDDYQRVFPSVKPKRGKWGESSFTVQRPTISKDPSVLGQGVLGAILGARIDRVVLDDIISFLNTITSEQREKSYRWIISTLLGRIVDGGRLEAIGTAWHRDDAMHRLEKLPAFVSRRERACTVTVRHGARIFSDPLWPTQWSSQRLEKRYGEIGELEFSRQMLNQPLVDGMSRFKMIWFERAWDAAAKAGRELGRGTSTDPAFTGVDLAVGRKNFHDRTMLATTLLQPDGKRVLASLHGGRWEGHEIVRQIIAEKRAYNSMVMIETNAAQEYMRGWVQDYGEAASGFITTGPKKLDREFGIESLAVELENGLWLIPRTPETEELAREAVYYDPMSDTGDRLMAWWFSREGVRAYGPACRSKTRSSSVEKSPGASIMEMDL